MAARRAKAEQGSRSTGGAIRRALGMLAFLPLASRVPLYARLIFALVADDRMPGSRKVVLGGALGYLLVGRDLVPDEVPLVGGLDDLVVVALAVDLFLDGVPDDLLEEKLDELGIDRRAFADDVANIRRLTPGPVRRTMRRIPGAIALAGDALKRTGIGPRVRARLNSKEPEEALA